MKKKKKTLNLANNHQHNWSYQQIFQSPILMCNYSLLPK
jgi:hypothetical protein